MHTIDANETTKELKAELRRLKAENTDDRQGENTSGLNSEGSRGRPSGEIHANEKGKGKDMGWSQKSFCV